MKFLSIAGALLLCIQLSATTPLKIHADQSTFLYGTKATSVSGEHDEHKGRFLSWKENAQLVWDVEIPSGEKYEIWLTINVRKAGKATELELETGNGSFRISLEPTSGPYPGPLNFEKIKLVDLINLGKGKQKITLTTRGTSAEEILFDFRSLELVPLSAKKEIKAEYKRALASRASNDWMVEAGYGLMFHWTSQSVQPDGSTKPYKEAVNEFDVERFVDMVKQTGAGYVYLTIGHAESYCPAPIKSWEKVHPGQTTERDLIEEIAVALEKENIRLLLYINGPLGFNLNVRESTTGEEKQAFVSNFKAILTEMGNRYGDKVAAYWFDSFYQIFEEFPQMPFEEFNKAAKTGYKDRLICLNSWIYPPVTPWQDFWAGEVGGPVAPPGKDGYMKNGPVLDLPYHALLIMEPYWVQKNAEMPEPRFTPEKLSEYIATCNRNKGTVCINLGIYQDGTVGEKALQVMREVKNQIRIGK